MSAFAARQLHPLDLLAQELADVDESWALLGWEEREHYRRLASTATEVLLGRDPRRPAPVADTWPERERRLLRQGIRKAHTEAQAQERRLGKLLERLEGTM
jgi:hypothetical protein